MEPHFYANIHGAVQGKPREKERPSNEGRGVVGEVAVEEGRVSRL
jgi:hypothetical protein